MFYILYSAVLLLLLFTFKDKLTNYWSYLFLSLSMPAVFIFQKYYNSFYNFMTIPDWKVIIIFMVVILFMCVKIMSEDSGFEVSALTLLLLFGALLVIVSEHLVIMYLAMELQTFCMFMLIAKNKSSLKGAEAALKYFILGAVSSGFLLLGISLLLYEGSSLTLENLSADWLMSSPMLQTGLILMVMSLIFKLAAAPLHFWIPDIYEGSSWSMIGMISTMAKISMMVVLQQMNFSSDLLIAMIILSLLVGTFGALNQTKLKSLLGYSGISHMGFILMGLLIMGVHGYESTYSYLVIYFLLMVGILGLSYLGWKSSDVFLVELGLYHTTNKLLALSWGVIFLSMAGMPPLSGFFSKWLMIVLLADHGYLFTLFISILVSAMGAGYYLSVVKMNYFQKESSYMVWEYALKEKKESQIGVASLVGVSLYVSLFLILNPNPLFSIFLVNCFMM